MISNNILNSDAFVDMSNEAKLAYVYIMLNADDEGFVSNINSILRVAGLPNNGIINELVENNFLIRFDNNILAIKHWYAQNRIRKDRCSVTVYQAERARLLLDKSRVYHFSDEVNEKETLQTPATETVKSDELQF